MKKIMVILILPLLMIGVLSRTALSAEDEAGPPGTNYAPPLSPEESNALALVLTLGTGATGGMPGSENADSGHDSSGNFR